LRKEDFSSTMTTWTFWDYHSDREENEILRWLNSSDVPKEAKAKINGRIISLQGFPIFPEQYFSAYKGWNDLYELRIVFGGVQYRPFGMYGPRRRQFSLLIGGIEKGRIPKNLLEAADERRKIAIGDPTRVRPHDFS
jgi:hypothetical protein